MRVPSARYFPLFLFVVILSSVSFSTANTAVQGKDMMDSKVSSQEQACMAGNMAACNALGDIYANAQGVKLDYKKAAALYKKACNGGEMNGCANLGWLYAYGGGVEINYALALKLLDQTCESGIADGCHTLGLLYYTGRGVVKNRIKALEFLERGCKGAKVESCDLLKSLNHPFVNMDRNESVSDKQPYTNEEKASKEEWVSFITLGLLIVGCVQAFIYSRQTKIMKGGLESARKAAEAAQSSTTIAQDAQRAWLSIEIAPAIEFMNDRGNLATNIHISVANIGKSPADSFYIHHDLLIDENLEDISHDKLQIFEEGMIDSVKGKGSVNACIFPDQRQKVTGVIREQIGERDCFRILVGICASYSLQDKTISYTTAIFQLIDQRRKDGFVNITEFPVQVENLDFQLVQNRQGNLHGTL